MAILISILVLLALIGLPLFIVLGAGGLYASIASEISPAGLIIELYRLASQPNLITIPLFTFAGMTMAAGGGPQRLLTLFNALLGWMPGGLAMAGIVSCAFFTAFTGASGVTIIALGGLLYPLFIKAHYSEKFTLGLLTSSGSLGLLFPPSLAILLYGIVSGTSIDELFLAGIIPGLVLLLMLSIYSYLTSRSQLEQTHEFSSRKLLSAVKETKWDIFLPILVITGIFGGFVTVAEAAAVTASYALFIETVIYKELKLSADLPKILIDTAKLIGSILIILGVAMGLTNLLIDSQLPMRLLDAIESHISSPLQFLLLLNLFLLIIGAMMDIFSAIVVVVPLIMPLAHRYQIDPVHLGIIFLANLEISYMTPPVGINLFIASQRFGKDIYTLFQSTLPFLLIMFIWLLMVSYLPVLTLWWK
ncbi:MAG TPA: TRAP transporter large permease subunit [Gammaproteobacteria bacterium]|nr:TRAP transporter large permease subunit [Gammaproteobacteria bacterium]